MAFLLAALAEDAIPVGGTLLEGGAVLALLTVLVRALLAQQASWRDLVSAGETRADASDVRDRDHRDDADAAEARAKVCEAQLVAAETISAAAQARAIAAEVRAVAAEAEQAVQALALDEVRRRLADLERPKPKPRPRRPT